MNGLRVSLCIGALGAALLPAVSAGQGSTMGAGKWEISTTIVSMEIAGMPPEISKALAGKTTTSSQCITPEMVAKGQINSIPKDCTLTSSTMSGGKISSGMVCRRPAGTTTTTDTGTYSANAYTITGKSVTTGKAASTSVMKISAKRVGGC